MYNDTLYFRNALDFNDPYDCHFVKRLIPEIKTITNSFLN